MRKDIVYSLEVIASAVEALCSRHGSYFSLRSFLPYCLYDIEGFIMPFNRDYNPICIRGGEYINYTSFSFFSIPRDLIDFSCFGKTDENKWWFFSDADTPIYSKYKKKYVDKISKSLFSKYKYGIEGR